MTIHSAEGLRNGPRSPGIGLGGPWPSSLLPPPEPLEGQSSASEGQKAGWEVRHPLIRFWRNLLRRKGSSQPALPGAVKILDVVDWMRMMNMVSFLKMGQLFKQGHLIQHERTASWAVALALAAYALGLSFRKTAQLLRGLGVQISHVTI